MRNIALPPVMHQYDDNGDFFKRELGGLPCPDIVKTAADMSVVPRDAADYAVVANTAKGKAYLYPIVDAGNTLVSAIYFEKTAGTLPPELQQEGARKICQALIEIGMEPTTALLDMLAINKTASLTPEWDSLFEKQKASDQELIDEVMGLAPTGRRSAVQMLKQAGVQVPEQLECYVATSFGSDLEYAVSLRYHLLDDAHKGDLHDLVKVAHLYPPEEIVETLQEFDLQYHLTRFYDTSLLDPYASVYGTSIQKLASKKLASIVIDNRAFDAAQITAYAQNHLEELDSVFGEGVALQIAESPVEVLSSLPLPHRQALAHMIRS